jgi:hypothetical protein
MRMGIRWIALFLALAGCAKDDSARPQSKSITAPEDQSDAAQRAQIDATLTKIEGLTSALGKPHTFRSVPIVVSTDTHYTDHPAACVALNRVPQFILVKPAVFEAEDRISPGGIDSTLFRVLLHEIGHCYFHREHEEEHISQPGRLVQLTVKQRGVTGKVDLPFLDATVMVPENLSVPIVLEKYYVAEILGVIRAKTLQDLAPYAPLKYVDELADQP